MKRGALWLAEIMVSVRFSSDLCDESEEYSLARPQLRHFGWYTVPLTDFELNEIGAQIAKHVKAIQKRKAEPDYEYARHQEGVVQWKPGRRPNKRSD